MNFGQTIDNRLQSQAVQYLTLCSTNQKPTPFQSLFERLPEMDSTWNPDWNLGLEAGIVSITEQILIDFPNNIFWDLDFLFLDLAKTFRNQMQQNETSFDNKIKRICELFHLFGMHSPIKFRYVHDFIYGYDWYKWIMEKKLGNQNPDPFGFDFLDYIFQRGIELCQLIDENDKKYPNLEGQFRNPFLFSRNSFDEKKLMETLRDTNDLPILAWDWNSKPKFEKNYSKLRLEVANRLGLKENTQAGSHKV